MLVILNLMLIKLNGHVFRLIENVLKRDKKFALLIEKRHRIGSGMTKSSDAKSKQFNILFEPIISQDTNLVA